MTGAAGAGGGVGAVPTPPRLKAPPAAVFAGAAEPKTSPRRSMPEPPGCVAPAADGEGPPISSKSITFCYGGAVVSAAGAVAVSLGAASAGSSESSESLESLLAVEMPPNKAAAALAFLRSALDSYGAALPAGFEAADEVAAALPNPPPMAGYAVFDLGVLLVSGAALFSSVEAGVAPHTFFTPLTAKEAGCVFCRPGLITPVTLNGADSPVLIEAALPPAL